MALTFNAIARAASFSPSQAFPLDARSYFESKDLAVAAALTAAEAGTKAASNTVYYIGQTLVVNENGSATLYIIQPDKTLKEVGSVPVGDGKSIEVVDGKIRLKGFGSGYYKYNQKYKPAPTEGEDNREEDEKSQYIFVEGEFKAGLQPQIVAASGEGATGFEIAWFEPNPTTVEGLQAEITALSSSVNTLTQSVQGKAESSAVYTKEQADNLFLTQDEVDAHINKVITDAVDGDTLTNLTQLVEYVNSHDTQILEDVDNLEKRLSGIDTTEGAVKKYVDDAIDALNIETYATAQSVTDLTGVVNNKADATSVYTKEEIDNKGFLTTHQNLDHKADKSVVDGLVDIINGSVETEGTLAYQLKQVENKIPTTNDIENLITAHDYIKQNAVDTLKENIENGTVIAATATQATNDSEGNKITDTYLRKDAFKLSNLELDIELTLDGGSAGQLPQQTGGGED